MGPRTIYSYSQANEWIHFARGTAGGQVSSNQTDRDHYCNGNENRKRAGDWQVGDQVGG